MWPFKRRKIAEQIAPPKRSAFTTDLYPALAKENGFNGLVLPQPMINGVGMDSIDTSVPSFKGEQVYGVPESQAAWYASQMFIGNNMCAIIAKHWLVDKACNMPARDAIRQGYDIDCDNDDDSAISKKLRKRDKKYRIQHHLKELIHFGRVYGGRLALFVVETSNPKEWYETPFNLDGVTKGMYKGIKQIDPQWVTPDLTDSNIQDPASMDFYDPTYYIIGGRKYHKSHFIKFVPFPVPNVLKPLYTRYQAKGSYQPSGDYALKGDAYTKAESDGRYQPKGSYQVAGYSYSKAESDTNYQPKGNYAPAGNYALKGDSYTKAEGDTRYQVKGSYQPSGDYATNTALNNGLNAKLNTSSVAQSTGGSTTSVMSQKAVTDALQNAVNLNTIYPIGIVVWFAQNKNPNTLFPGTKWQYIGENKTIRLAAASGANVLTTGGSDSVTIGKGHLPAVSLKYSGTTVSSGGHTHTRGTMNITGEFGYIRSDNAIHSMATGAFSLANGGTGYNGNNTTGGYKYVFNASKTWSGETSNSGAHTHTYSGNTENLGSGTALTVTNAYIMLMGWYRLS